MNTISGVYKITNSVTGEFYIGSSKNIKNRWKEHKWPSTWNKYPNNLLYQDMQKYGTDKFVFEILEEVESDKLKEMEQLFIEKLNPTYNNINANGLNIERLKEYKKTDKYKEYQKEYQNKYKKEYNKSDKGKESLKKANNKYYNQLCFYNGETLTLRALSSRFRRKGIDHPVIEAKKYLIKDNIKE